MISKHHIYYGITIQTPRLLSSGHRRRHADNIWHRQTESETGEMAHPGSDVADDGGRWRKCGCLGGHEVMAP